MAEGEPQQDANHAYPVRQWWMGVTLVTLLFVALTRDLWLQVGVARGDVLNFFLPYYMLLTDFARHGQLMLWDPWSSGGIPIFADAQTGALSPLTNLFALITGPHTGGYLLYSLCMWLIGPLGVMVLGRHLRAPVWGCVIAATAYMVCGVYLGQPHHLSHHVSFSFIPWVLWRLDAALLQRRVRPALEASALLGLSGLGGYPGLTFLTALYCGLWATGRIVSTWRQWNRRALVDLGLASLASIIVLAVVLAPPYLGMLYEGRGYTSRSAALDRDYAISVQPTAPEALLTLGSTSAQLAVNEVLQQRSPYERVLPMRVSVACGFLALALALCAVITAPRDIFRWFLLAIGVLFLAIATGREMPLRGWLYDLVPPIRMIRHAGIFRDYWFISAISLALLASREITDRRHLPYLVLLSSAIGVLSVGTYLLMAPYVGIVGGPWAIAQLSLPALLVAALLLWPGSKHITTALAAAAVVDAALAVQLCSDRTFAFRDTNAQAVWQHFDRDWRTDLSVSADRAALVSGWNEHLVGKQPILASYTPLRHHLLPHSTDSAAGKQQALRRLAFATSANRFWWSSDAPLSPANAGASRPDLLRVQTRDALLGSAADAAPSFTAPMQQVPVRVDRYTPTQLTLTLDSPASGWLLVTDRWSRSWSATVNGSAAEVFGGNDLYRAIRVPAGSVSVDFRYGSTWIYALTGVSWATLAFVGVMSLIQRKRGGVRR